MSATSSTNATALPDRRHFLSTVAAAGALGMTAVPAMAGTSAHLDAELLELGALLAAADARADELADRSDEAYERFVPPPTPDALFWRRSDHLVVWVDRKRLDSVGEPGDERYTYASEGVLSSLREDQARWSAIDPLDRPIGDRVAARVEEIITHLEAYEAEEARRLEACGYAAADQAEKAQREHVEALRLRIATAAARTPDGVCVKVRASIQAQGCIFYEEHRFGQLLVNTDRSRGEMAELLALSAKIDATKLGGASSSDRRAA